MIDQQTVDRIFDAADIYDVVSEYVTLRRSGASYKGLCPFHDDKTPSFYVNPARGICKCFSCGKGGNAVTFIMEIEQMTFTDALRHLAKRYNIEIKEEAPSKEELKLRGEREKMLAANEWASQFFYNNLMNTPEGQAVGLAYFRNRGFRDDIIEKFRLGYAPDKWDALSKEAQKKGFKDEVLVSTSLAYKKDNGQLNDKFRGRVMFPWFSLSGQVLAFGGRVLDARTKGVNQKYINSNDSEIYHKQRELYGLFQAKRQIAKEQQVYMVEGYTDVLSMHQCGIENVVANSGTALNDAQIRLLKRFTDNITLIYDGDEAGIHAALRGTDMLLAQNMNVKVLLLPDGDDPDSFARKHNAQQFREYVTQNQTDFIIFKINHLLSQASNDPRKRSEVTESILQSISVIPDEIVRSTYLHECSEMMNMDEQMLLRRCLQLIRQHREQKQKEKEREQQRLEYLEKKKQAGETPAAVEAQTNGQPQVGDVPQAMQQDIPEETNSQTQLETIAPPVQPTTPPMDAYQPQAEQTNDKDMAKILGMETLIMRMIVRYGEFKLIFEDADGEKTQVPVARFVKEELEVDGMNFQNQMYVRMMDSILGRVDDAEFSCSKFFLTSTDLEVSAFAANMLNDKYQLDSKALVEPEESTLSTSIPRLLLDYKFYVVRREIQMLKKQLTDRNVICDSEKMMEVMKRSKFLMDIQKKLAKELGDRIVSA